MKNLKIESKGRKVNIVYDYDTQEIVLVCK